MIVHWGFNQNVFPWWWYAWATVVQMHLHNTAKCHGSSDAYPRFPRWLASDDVSTPHVFQVDLSSVEKKSFLNQQNFFFDFFKKNFNLSFVFRLFYTLGKHVFRFLYPWFCVVSYKPLDQPIEFVRRGWMTGWDAR